jgi:Uma2 family endonuclease
MALTATQSPPVIALQARTYEDLLALPDDGQGYELIFGEIVMPPSPTTKHQRALNSLFGKIDRFTQERTVGDVSFAPLDVKLSHNAVQPDLFFVRRERDEIVTDDFIDGAPDLIVEVLSPSDRMQDL